MIKFGGMFIGNITRVTLYGWLIYTVKDGHSACHKNWMKFYTQQRIPKKFQTSTTTFMKLKISKKKGLLYVHIKFDNLYFELPHPLIKKFNI